MAAIDALRTGTTRVVALGDLLGSVAPAYFGPTWRDAVTGMLASRHDRAVVADLVGELRRDGSFIEPVWVDLDAGELLNGMHRVIASVVAGAETIAVTDSPEPPSGDAWELTFTVSGGGNHDELFETVVTIARSFPSPRGWFQTDHLSWCGGTFSGVWYCPVEALPSLRDALVARLDAAGLVSVVVDVTAFSWDD